MSSNLEIGSFLNKKSIIPPLGFYQPNYDYVQTKSPQIYLNRKNPELITNLNVN